MSVTVYLGLGSSLGRRAEHLRAALRRLQHGPERIEVCAVSPVYESPHLGREPGDAERFPPHLNLAAQIETNAEPEGLLRHIHAVETAGGRTRTQVWGPRTIDIDILLYGLVTLSTDVLTLPHPGLTDRAFVVLPLADLAPNLRLPNGGTPAELRCAPLITAQTIVRYADTLDEACEREAWSNIPLHVGTKGEIG